MKKDLNQVMLSQAKLFLFSDKPERHPFKGIGGFQNFFYPDFV